MGIDCTSKVAKVTDMKDKLNKINKSLLTRMKGMETKFMEEQERSSALNLEKLVA